MRSNAENNAFNSNRDVWWMRLWSSSTARLRVVPVSARDVWVLPPCQKSRQVKMPPATQEVRQPPLGDQFLDRCSLWQICCWFVAVENGTGTCRFGSLTHWQWINDQTRDVPEAFWACVAHCRVSRLQYQARRHVVVVSCEMRVASGLFQKWRSAN
jgi:hypothetical protein